MRQPAFFFADPTVATFLIVGLATTLAALAAGIVRNRELPRNSNVIVALCALAAIVLVAVYAIEAPQTPFIHYLLFLTLPVAGLTGLSIAFFLSTLPRSANVRWASLGLLAAALAFTAPAAQRTIGEISLPPELRLSPSVSTDAAAPVLSHLIRPNQRVAMWGWMPQYFVYTGALMGTRDSISQFQIEERPFKPYYRTRYLADFARTQPTYVLEAIGPNAFAYHDRLSQGIVSFPALQHIIDTQYRIVYRSDSLRIYGRLRATGIADGKATAAR